MTTNTAPKIYLIYKEIIFEGNKELLTIILDKTQIHDFVINQYKGARAEKSFSDLKPGEYLNEYRFWVVSLGQGNMYTITVKEATPGTLL